MKTLYKFTLQLVLVLLGIWVTITPLYAQSQSFNFSGNNLESYNCIQKDGTVLTYIEAWTASGTTIDPSNPPRSGSGRFLCPDNNDAILRPPALQQLEVWFVRVIYVIWAAVASFSFFFLVVLAYRWLISRGDVTKITEIRQKIIYYFIGVALVFLAIPILTTVFRVLGINKSNQCYNVNMPGFQFFFADLCTDPRSVVTDPCSFSAIVEDIARGISGESRYACPVRGEIKTCGTRTLGFGFCCTNDDNQVWVSYFIAPFVSPPAICSL